MFARLVSKEASGPQESKKAPYRHLKNCVQPKKRENKPTPCKTIALFREFFFLSELGMPGSHSNHKGKTGFDGFLHVLGLKVLYWIPEVQTLL